MPKYDTPKYETVSLRARPWVINSSYRKTGIKIFCFETNANFGETTEEINQFLQEEADEVDLIEQFTFL